MVADVTVELQSGEKGEPTAMILPGVVAAGFAGMVLAPVLTSRVRGAHWLLAALPLALFAVFVALGRDVVDGETLSWSHDWVPGLGITLAFRLDGLALLFALLITGIGSLVVLYAGEYLHGKPYTARFLAILFAFMASMLGLVLADDLILLFIFWELTSITSYGLISIESGKEKSRKAALQALLVTAGGGLALLGGFLLLASATGTQDIGALTGDSLAGVRYYDAIVILVLLGAFTKSAQFPFHFWLPNAMAAPTPVSAYLHSATMVKAGVYLLARMTPALGGTDTWYYALVLAGGVTMLTGSFLALREDDLKRILAYVTVAILGALVMLLGVGTSYAITAALVLLLAHALYKACLFLVAGIVDHEAGTRMVSELGGLARAMPVTAAASLLAAVSMAGIPLAFGFIAKELTYESLLGAPDLDVLVVVMAVAANAMMILAAYSSAVRPFVGVRPGAFETSNVSQTHRPHDPGIAMLAGPVILAAAGIAIGVAPALLDSPLNAAASAALGADAGVHLAIWHGLNTALLMSGITFALGAALILGRTRVAALARTVSTALTPVSPERTYERAVEGLNRLATAQANVFQSGYLRRYVATTFLVATGLVIATVVAKGGAAIPENTTRVVAYEVAVLAVVLLGGVLALCSRSRITAVISLGMTGYGIALIYILYGAPDLAMTQILVETLAVLVFVFAFSRMPKFRDLSSRAARARDAVIAISAGAMVTVMLLATVSTPRQPEVSQLVAESSKPLGHGSNIVNVILVDFRALDTMGEIVVLGVAAVGGLALLRARAKGGARQ